jgi:hypothetical protein
VTRDIFWFVAGLMAAMAALLIAVPLLRARQGAVAPRPRYGLWIGAAIVAGIGAAMLVLYRTVGTPSAMSTASTAMTDTGAAMPAPENGAVTTAPSMEESAARLADRLAREGGTGADWELLARSYEFLGRDADATAARERAANAPAADATAPAAAPTPTAGAARIEGSVELAPDLRARVSAGDMLFIYARETGAGGPPLAVLRLSTGSWPLSFVLDDRNSMIPGRDLSHASKVVLEARISRSGNATPQAGDLVGTVENVNPRAGQPVRISIDRVR